MSYEEMYEKYKKELEKATRGFSVPNMDEFAKMSAFYNAVVADVIEEYGNELIRYIKNNKKKSSKLNNKTEIITAYDLMKTHQSLTENLNDLITTLTNGKSIEDDIDYLWESINELKLEIKDIEDKLKSVNVYFKLTKE